MVTQYLKNHLKDIINLKLLRENGEVKFKAYGVDIDERFNGEYEPGDKFIYGCHVVDLSESTIDANKRFFDSIDDVPKSAITMGIGTIMAARKVLLIATGADKKEILKKTLFGPVDPQVPASILQFFKGEVVICADEAALAVIKAKHPEV